MFARPAITIGSFDGVHLGHAALVRAAAAAAPGGPVIALSFEPHPTAVLRPEAISARLSRFDQRGQWLIEAGATQVVPLVPTRELLSMSPLQFISQLVTRYQPAAIVEGPDFRFGAGRAGSIDSLRAHERSMSYRTIEVEPVEAALCDHQLVRVSSSMIRWLLGRGRVRDARLLLGRPYELRALVIRGEQRGRAIGVPTVNLDHQDQLLPADGVYAGMGALPDGREFPAAISVGAKPTFGAHPRLCEAHLIGYRGPLDDYGWMIRLEVHDWLRDQLTYTNVEALIDQLRRDISAAERCVQGHTLLRKERTIAMHNFSAAGIA